MFVVKRKRHELSIKNKNKKANEAYLQTQLGNPDGADKPNKKYYDPRKWLREGQNTLVASLEKAFDDLNCIGRN